MARFESSYASSWCVVAVADGRGRRDREGCGSFGKAR